MVPSYGFQHVEEFRGVAGSTRKVHRLPILGRLGHVEADYFDDASLLLVDTALSPERSQYGSSKPSLKTPVESSISLSG